MAVVVVEIVRKKRILGFAGGFDTDCETNGGVNDDSLLFGLNNHRMQLPSTEEEVAFGHVRFGVCIRYPSGVDEQAIY